jgi:hypothetical protein
MFLCLKVAIESFFMSLDNVIDLSDRGVDRVKLFIEFLIMVNRGVRPTMLRSRGSEGSYQIG